MRQTTRSPHFTNNNHNNGTKACCDASTDLPESRFFRQSPSSAIGSVRSLGPLLFCFTLEPDLRELPLEDASTEFSRGQLSDVVDSAVQHFSCCPQFCECWSKNAPLLDSDVSKQVRAVERSLHAAVRHLCPKRCFMRAFAPYRDWFALRRLVSEHATAESVEELLDGWRCVVLLAPSNTATRDDGSPPLSKTAFVHSPSEKSFSDPRQVLCLLGLLHPSKKEHVGNPVRPKRRRLLGHEQREESDSPSPKTLFSPSSCDSIVDTPFGLLEELFVDDPWKLLLSTIFLNRTSRVQVDAVLFRFLQEWPSAASVMNCRDVDRISDIIQPMGMWHRRAAGIIRFSREYVNLIQRKSRESGNNGDKHDDDLLQKTARNLTRSDVLSLYCCGDYAYAAYQLFIQRNWYIDPPDHALKAYAEFQRGIHNSRSPEIRKDK